MNPRILKIAFWTFLTLSTICLAALGVIDMDLRNTTTPGGIISFEFCGYASSCDAALLAWGTQGQALALLSLGLDYLYMVLYPGLICTGLLLVASHVPQALKGVTVKAAWFSPGAGLADAIENYALIQIVLHQSDKFYGLPASVFATIKFLIFGSTFLWLLFTSVRFVLFKRR